MRPDVGQQVHEVGDLGERHEVVLNVLAGGEVAFAAAELFGDFRELVGLCGSQQAAGDFAADHLDARLALAVDAVFQAERAEIVLGDFAREEGRLPFSGTFRSLRERSDHVDFQALRAGEARIPGWSPYNHL